MGFRGQDITVTSRYLTECKNFKKVCSSLAKKMDLKWRKRMALKGEIKFFFPLFDKFNAYATE